MEDKGEKQNILPKNSYNNNGKNVEQHADDLLSNNDLSFLMAYNEAKSNINNAQSSQSLKNLNIKIDNNKSK